jgi:hypothetical protein
MSMDEVKKDKNIEGDTGDASVVQGNNSTVHKNWHIRIDGFWENVDSRFYNDELPNQPPLLSVNERLAAEIKILDEDDIVSKVSEFFFPESPDRYTEVARVLFNDLSTWHIPLPPWDKDYEKQRVRIVDRYIPEIIKWSCIIYKKDYQTEIEKWEDEISDQEKYEWMDRINDTEFTEEDIKWLNENMKWVETQHKVVKSDNDNVELNIGKENSWEDDW